MHGWRWSWTNKWFVKAKQWFQYHLRECLMTLLAASLFTTTEGWSLLSGAKGFLAFLKYSWTLLWIKDDIRTKEAFLDFWGWRMSKLGSWQRKENVQAGWDTPQGRSSTIGFIAGARWKEAWHGQWVGWSYWCIRRTSSWAAPLPSSPSVEYKLL